MKNRFMDLLIQKQRQEEEKALNDSYGINPENDPTKYNPWDDSKDDKKDN